MTDIDERRDQYFPCDSNIAFKRTGQALLEKWGMEGLCAWVLLLAASKREPVQGTFTYSTDAEAWSKLGATPQGFTLDELLTFLGHRKQTSRRRHGRLTYVQIRGWTRWNQIARRRRDAAQKSRKRHESTSDIEETSIGHVGDTLRTRARGSDSEVDSEVPPYPPSPNGTNPEHRRRASRNSDEPKHWTSTDVHSRIVKWIASPAYDPETMDDTFVLDELVVAENRMHASVTPEQRADLLDRAKARRESVEAA